MKKRIVIYLILVVLLSLWGASMAAGVDEGSETSIRWCRPAPIGLPICMPDPGCLKPGTACLM